eukprot:TRINITY_DN17345_c0_g1_i1.p1 TRINITY_DN17345_c0_g1~~TRINITY_DN17345_c0_g1_i1.p1  ORF type:complete len:2992 (+),score=957.80 TRINITY_DN17345_c0_g1_i1:109-8976(+)
MAAFEASHVLDGLRKRFDQLSFEVDAADGVPSVRSFDRTFGFIDDTLVIINDICQEKDTGLGDRDALIELRGELLLLNEVLEKFGRCQSQARYLFPLFTSGEARRQLEQWNAIMQELSSSRDSARVLATQQWLERLRELNHDYETLSLRLGDLVAERQDRLHHFYFCSHDEVLTILSEASHEDVGRVQPFFRRLFGFASAQWDEEGVISCVRSDAGEEVPLLRRGAGPDEAPVPHGVPTAGLPLEQWLGELARATQRSVLLQVLSSMSSFEYMRFRDWVMMGPTQAMITAVQVVFTRRVDTGLKRMETRRTGSSSYESICDELRQLLGETMQRVADAASWVVAGNRRGRVRQLLSVLMWQRGCLEDLLMGQVSSRSDLRWQGYQRWYADKMTRGAATDEIAKQRDLQTVQECYAGADTWFRVRTEVSYCSYDFYGDYAPQRAVLMQCPEQAVFHASVLQTLQSQCVGCVVCAERPDRADATRVAAFEPASLLAELAHSLGKPWQLLRCTSETPIATVAKCMKGAFCSGVWLCFQDIDKLDPTTLSLIHEGCLSTQDALRTKAPHYQFEGKVIPIASRTFAIFGTLSGGAMNDVTRAGIEQLQQLLRPITLPKVPVADLVCWHLQLHGLDRLCSEQLGRQLSTFVDRLLKHHALGRQVPPAARLVAELLSAVSQTIDVMESPGSSPGLLMCSAAYKAVLRQVSPELWDTVKWLVVSCFGPQGVVSPLQQVPLLDGLQESLVRHAEAARKVPSPLFIAKCGQVYDALRCSPAIIIAGPAASGKTSMWQTVQRSSVPKGQCALIFPRALSAPSIFGWMDSNNDWIDGPFTHIFRQFAQSPDEGGQDWIVLDGDLSAETAAAIAPLVDPDSRMLVLETGEIIRAKPSFRLIFETGDADTIPGVLRDHCALVRTDGGVLGADEYIHYHASDPNFFLSLYQQEVTSALERIVAPTVAWAERRGARVPWDGGGGPRREGEIFFPLNTANLVRSCFNVINGFRNKRVSRYASEEAEGLTSDHVEPLVLFSFVWSFGTALCSTHQQRVDFNQFVRHLVVDAGLTARFPTPFGSELGLVFDYVFDLGAREWVRWGALPEMQPSVAQAETDAAELWAPSQETMRHQWVVQHLADKGVSLLLCGPEASGKASILMRSLRHFTTIQCAETEATDMQSSVGTRLQKSREGIICLPDKLEKPIYLVLHDMELARPSCADFIRQLRDNGGWYDGYTNALLRVHDVSFAATCSAQGIQGLSERQLLPFHFVSAVELEKDEIVDRLSVLFQNFLSGASAAEDGGNTGTIHQIVPPPVQQQVSEQLATTLADVGMALREHLPLRDNPVHYWPLSGLFSVARSICTIARVKVPHMADVLRLLVHQCEAVFAGRLSAESREWVLTTVWDAVQCNFPDLPKDEIMRGRDHICWAGIEDFREWREPPSWVAALAGAAEKYAATAPHPLVLDLSCGPDGAPSASAQNVTDLHNALRHPGSHVLLLTDCPDARLDELRLATFLLDGNLFHPELTVHHTHAEWRDFLKDTCMHCIVSVKPDVAMVRESMLTRAALADIGALARTGELCGLFSQTDWSSITVVISEWMRRRGEYLRGRDHVRHIARLRILQQLRFVVSADPSAAEFAERMAAVPAVRTHFCVLQLRAFDISVLCTQGAPHYTAPEPALRAAVDVFAAVRRHVEQQSGAPHRHSVDLSPTALTLLLRTAEEVGKRSAAAREERKQLCARGLAALAAFKPKDSEESEVAAAVQSRWQQEAEGDTPGEEVQNETGDALLYAASVVWLGALPASERVTLLETLQEVLAQHNIAASASFDAAEFHLAPRPAPGGDLERWRRGGLLGSALQLFAVACEALPPSRAVCLVDPHSLAIPYLRAAAAAGEGQSRLDIVPAPFSTACLARVADAVACSGTVVLDSVSAADLSAPWLVAVIVCLWHAQEGRGTLRIGDRELPLSPGFRLVLLLREELWEAPLPPPLRTSVSVISLQCEREQLAELFCAEAQATACPSPLSRLAEAAAALHAAELRVTEVPSGSAVEAARWEQELPQLLGAVAEGARNVSELRRELRAAWDRAAPARPALLHLGRLAADAFLSAATFSRCHPCSQFALGFFADALCEVVRLEGEVPPEEWTAKLPLVADKLMRYYFDRVSASAPYAIDATALGWLMAYYSNRGTEEQQLQDVAVGGGPLGALFKPEPNPDPDWILPEGFCSLVVALHTAASGLEGVWEEFSNEVEMYRDYYTGPDCVPGSGMPSWHFPCERALRVAIFRALRPDLLLDEMQMYAASSPQDGGIGIPMPVQPPEVVTALRGAILEGDPRTPLLVITPDDDADDHFTKNMQLITQQHTVTGEDGRTESMARRTFFIAAAPSQKAMAASLVRDACRVGGWIVCTGVLVSDDFAREIDSVADDLQRSAEAPHPLFRLVLQTASTKALPASLVRRCRKLGFSRALGLRGELLGLYDYVSDYFTNPSSASGLSAAEHLHHFQELLPCVVLFHGLVAERQARGWLKGNGVRFGRNSLRAAVRETVRIISQNPTTARAPVLQVRNQIAALVYGARVASPSGRAVLRSLAERCIHSGSEGDSYSYGSRSDHFIGNIVHGFKDYIGRLPDTAAADPETTVLGSGWLALHACQQVMVICDAIRQLSRPSVVSPSHPNLATAIGVVTARMPSQLFDVAAAFEWLPAPTNSVLRLLYPLMQQELQHYSTLLSTVQRDLHRISLAQRGEMRMDAELVAVAQRLAWGEVPHSWLRCSGHGPHCAPCTADCASSPTYRDPSLGAWLEHVRAGHTFFRQWSCEGQQPAILQLAAFIDPGALFWAMADQAAAAEGLSVADIQLDLKFEGLGIPASEVSPARGRGSAPTSPRHAAEAAAAGACLVSGLWVQNGAWSPDEHRLVAPRSARVRQRLPLAQLRAFPCRPESPSALGVPIYKDSALAAHIAVVDLQCGAPGADYWALQDVVLTCLPW